MGLGPYRFVAHGRPGQELVLEANEQYWRKKPSIKRVVIKGVPDRTTRLAMLKTGEADIGYLMVGVEAATIKADPKLRLAQVIPQRGLVDGVPRAVEAQVALARPPRPAGRERWPSTGRRINEAERLGYSRLTGSIIPSIMDFALRIEPYPYDPAQREAPPRRGRLSQRLRRRRPHAAAPVHHHGRGGGQRPGRRGHPHARARHGAGDLHGGVARARSSAGVIVNVTAARATRPPASRPSWSSSAAYAYGGYPDIDDLFLQQAQERDRKKREALLHQIQRLMHERVMHGPIFEPATLHGVGPRVEEAGVGLNPLLYMAAP